MKQPIKVEVDREVEAGYVYYSFEKVAKTQHVSLTVLVDRDDEGAVIGIEILGFDNKTLEETRGLAM